jgi:hypothetical protein
MFLQQDDQKSFKCIPRRNVAGLAFLLQERRPRKKKNSQIQSGL